MSDRWVIACAVAIAAGALLARPLVPRWLVIVAIALAIGMRWPAALVVASGVMASVLSADAIAGLHPPTNHRADERRPVSATLVSDPVEVPGGVRADVRLAGKHLRATARGADAGRLRWRLAGERIRVRGSVRALTPGAAGDRLAAKHIAGRLTIHAIDGWARGGLVARAANTIRRTLLAGASSMPPSQRALFAGIVLGDDRDQDVAQAEDFRAAGLAHLLAVSGQNVAFVIAVASPVLRRLRPAVRAAAAIGVLGLFGAVTRWEPSVVRATAMAALSILVVATGRPASRLRLLALAVSVALLIDPLLVRSIGFLMSVGACVGIAVLVPPLVVRRVPEPLAVTIAAQLGVAPVLLPAFGGMPAIGPVANVLAVPAAGPVMAWGIVAGLPAGIAVRAADALAGRDAAPVAAALHVPTRLLLAWIAAVARLSAAIPAGWITPLVAVVAVVAAAAVAAMTFVLSRRSVTGASIKAAVLALVAACVVPIVFPAPANGAELGTGGDDRLWRRGRHAAVVTDGRAPPGRLLASLRERGVARLDVLVVTRAGRTAGRAIEPVLARLPTTIALAPPNRAYGTDPARTSINARPGARLRAGPWTIIVVAARPSVRVQIASAREARARSPCLRRGHPCARHGHPQPHA